MNIIFKMNSINNIINKRGLEPNGKVQTFLTNEIARVSNPYVPWLNGGLKDKQVLITPSQIKYYAPYATKQYYENVGMGKQGTAKGGLRGKRWTERAWADHGKEIVVGAIRIDGGK